MRTSLSNCWEWLNVTGGQALAAARINTKGGYALVAARIDIKGGLAFVSARNG